jgi:class 3 adenylate cyclase
VALLNQIFSAFDELAEQHGLEKIKTIIKTIGDVYEARSLIFGGLNWRFKSASGRYSSGPSIA